MEIEVRGEKLSLFAERAVFWHEQNALLVADPHWGKAATFRARGEFLCRAVRRQAIGRLDTLLKKTDATKVFFLGDLLHAKAGRSNDMFSALEAWRKKHEGIEVTLVRGNHDKRAGDPPPELCFNCVDAPLRIAPFLLAHHPSSDRDGYVLAGHVHPGVRLYGPGRQRERLPCFVFTKDYAILPAFGDFTGMADIEPDEATTIYAIADDTVVFVSKWY